MKTITVVAIATIFITMGFTAVDNEPEPNPSSKFQNLEKTDFSQKLDEKRLASWD